MPHIIKRKGHEEVYDGRKIYASVYAASINAHRTKEDSERIAEDVCNTVSEWIEHRGDISSDNIFQKATEELRKLDPDAGFMYETHRDLS